MVSEGIPSGQASHVKGK